MVLCDQFQSSQSSPPQSLPLTSINFRCPEQFGYYADEYNCSKYFVCVFGEALHESCTGGLRFSSELQTCDWPRNVICPYEDSDYDETEDDFVDSGSYSLSNNNNNKQQQQVGSGMIIETKNPTTTTTSTTTAKPLSSSNSDFYDNHHPFILLNHKSQPSSFTKSLLPPSSTNATTTIQQQQTPTHQISAKTSPSTNGLFSIRNNLSVNNNNQYTTPTSHHNHNHNHQNDNSQISYHHGTTTTTTTTRYLSNTKHSLNEQDIIQDSFNKLIKQQQQQQQQQKHHQKLGRQSNIIVNNNRQIPNQNATNNHNQHNHQHSFVNPVVYKSNDNYLTKITDIDENRLNFQPNRQQSNNQINNHRHNQHIDDDLDENFTLVDLQRSRHDDDHQHQQPTNHHIAGHNDDIRNDLHSVGQINQNLLGRSVNGENNHAQSVSVVASTSSKARIPELDFVFKNQNIDKHRNTNNNNDNDQKQQQLDNHRNNNRLLIDEILQLANAFNNKNDNNDDDGKFDDVITAIVDENGAIHLAGNNNNNNDDSAAELFRLLSSTETTTMKNQLFDSPGLAASNRNSASQQLLLSKNSSNNNSPNNRLSADGDKFKYQTSHHHQAEIDDQSNPINIDFDRIEPGAILVYNKTKLIVVPETKFSNQTSKNSSSNDQILLPNYITIPDHHSDDDDKPRQLITRTDKESSSSVNNKSQANIYSTISSLNIGDNVNVNDDVVDDINIMVNHLPNSDMILTDFQRIGTNRNDTDVYRKSKIPEYRQSVQSSRSNSTATTTSNRSSHARHLGSHHRGVNKSSIPTTTTATTTGTTTTNSTRTVKNLQIPSRPVPVYKTPEPFSNAIKCSEQLCKLPDCFCGGTEIPGELSVKDVPQLVLISFDDAVNDINWHIYEELLNSGRSNPNGCPIKATFYVSHEWTDYSQVQTLYSRGHEIASHSITHSFGESYTSQQWHNEIVGQREILHLYGGVNKADIRGMRAPFLQGGGNKQFEMLHEENFTYDSSMPVFENSPPFWPYTLDYTINHECMIAPCPTKSFPGLWEIGLVMWQDLRGGRCSMGDACSNPSDENGVYDLIMKNFKRHYNSNRAPFGLYYHSAWFNSEHHRQGFLRVIDDLLTYYKDVYFVTKWELIQWIRNPTALKELYRVNLFSCARDPNRPPPCLHPNICNVGANSGVRFLKTCQPCPKRYPWLDDNGQ